MPFTAVSHARRVYRQARPAAAAEPLDRRVLMSAGDPDPAFNGGVPARISFPGANFVVNDVAIQPDGKVVAAGTKAGSMVVTRLNADGTLDTAFGNGGLFESDRAPEARRIAIAPDGKILLATGPHPGGFDFQAMRVARLQANGASFDLSFGGDGFANYQVNNPSIANALALQADGKVVVVGTTQSGDFDLVVIRYNTDGSPDATFDSDGFVNLGFGEDEEASAVAIDYNGTPASNPYYGTIVVVGDKRPSRGEPSTNFTIARLNPNGSPDARFDGDGKLTSPDLAAGATEAATGVLLQADGRIVVGGTALANGVGDFLLARYMPDGAIDPSFGGFGAGIVRSDFGGDERALDLAPNYFGGILVSGGRNSLAAVAAYTANGSPETKFSGDGFMAAFGGAAHVATSLNNATPVRRIVLGGGSNVGRYFDVGTLVSLASGIQETSEATQQTINVIVARLDRAATAQRVYLNFGGTATSPIFGLGNERDYTLSGVTQAGFNVPRSYIDIAPNQTVITFGVTPINDTRPEGDETIVIRISPDDTYDTAAPSAEVTLVIRDDDLVGGPAVAASSFLYETAPQVERITFTQNVAGSVADGDFVITGPAGATVPPHAFAYDHVTNTASLSFATPLPDGNYTVRAVAAGITNAAGQPMAADATVLFFVLAGDANRDRAVNIADFSILANRFNLPGTFSQGDFDYDGTVGIGDFSILASKFNTTLPEPLREGNRTAHGSPGRDLATSAAAGRPRGWFDDSPIDGVLGTSGENSGRLDVLTVLRSPDALAPESTRSAGVI